MPRKLFPELGLQCADFLHYAGAQLSEPLRIGRQVGTRGAPFPLKALAYEMARFRNADVVWCQEEPKNMGAWSFVEPYLEWVLGQANSPVSRARYVGRPASASTAAGQMSRHMRELQAFINEALA